MQSRTRKSFKPVVTNILLSGGIGGVEVLCASMHEENSNTRTYYDNYIFLNGKGPIYDELLNTGANVCSYETLPKICITKLYKIKRRVADSDAIVFHDANPVSAPYLIALRFLTHNKRICIVLHNCYEPSSYYPSSYHWSKKIVWYLLLRTELCLAHKLIFVSDAGKESFLKAFKIPIQKTNVVYNGISQKQFMAGEARNEPKPRENNHLVLLYIGRLAAVKNVASIILAMAEINNHYNVELYVVGDGEERDNLQRITTSHSLQEKVHFEGFQRDLDKYYYLADFFIYPSICQEVFGLSIVEAMAYGLPCISNRVGGIPEIIENGKNGILTRGTSVDELAECIIRVIMLSDTERQQYFAEAQKTAKRFLIHDTINGYIEVFTH